MTDLTYAPDTDTKTAAPAFGENAIPENVDIYIPTNATGYTSANGWNVNQLHQYKITKQPQSITVKESEISNAMLSCSAVVIASGGSIGYEWYQCEDASGKNPTNLYESYAELSLRFICNVKENLEI